jgi:type IX secretion system PorP/SprF family membrane protein
MRTFFVKLYFLLFTIFFIGFICIPEILTAQDLHFSQYYNSPLSLNPSLTGAFKGNVRLITNYRSQWGSISVPSKTYAFSSEFGLLNNSHKKGHLGLGMSFYNDQAGVSQLDLTQMNLSVAFHEQLNTNNVISAGIQAGIAQRSINFDKLKWDNQYNGSSYDPSLPTYETNYNNNLTYTDFAGGIQWAYNSGEIFSSKIEKLLINAGAAVFHINQPDISFYSVSKDILPIKVVVHANSQIGFKKSKMSFIPSIVYIQQGPMKNVILGGMVRIKLVDESRYTGFIKGAALSFGVLGRFNDAVIPVAELEFANYAIGMTYDVNTSGLSAVSYGKGGFEISLKFVNPNPFTGKSIFNNTHKFYN